MGFIQFSNICIYCVPQNGSNAVMLACFADFGEVLTALVEEFGMDVTAKDFVRPRDAPRPSFYMSYIVIVWCMYVSEHGYTPCIVVTVVHV